MAKLSSTNIYGDLTVDGTIRGTVNGSITGNAATATALQTARTINGTSFNGTANITTANWGTARTLTIGNKGKSVNGSGNVSWSLSEIGAAASSHTHSYLPLSGGTMTGKITTPNNAQGITIGDDATLCDRNIADHIVIEGSTATNGGITFGSGKDTNIYRGGANLLKTDDTMNAVGGFQWNGQSLDSRYAAASHTHNYAASAHNHTSLYGASGSSWTSATRNIQTDLLYEFSSHISKNATGLFPTGDNSNAIITINRHSGHYDSQLGFNSTGQIYYRYVDGSAMTDSVSWQKIYTSSNKPTLSEIGAAASSHTHSYLPLSGGTMTGKISGGSMTGTWVAAAGGSSFINSTASAGNFHPMLSAKTTNGGMTLAFYQTGLQVGYLTKANIDAGTNTLAKNAVLMDESGNGTWPGIVSAVTFKENGTALSSKYAAASHTHSYAASNHTHTLFTRNSVGDIGWSTSSNQGLPVAVSAIAYWNGAYSGTTSNLTYCNKGAFGTMATQNTSSYVKSKKLTQSAYNSATKDASTLYIIVG